MPRAKKRPAPCLPVGPPGRWAVEIPNWLPTPLNVLMRMHWAARNRRLKAEYRVIAIACLVADVSRATGKRRVSLDLTLAGRDRTRDEDGAWKGVMDGLTNAGALVDDAPAWVARGLLGQARGVRRGSVVTIQDLDEVTRP